MDPEPSRSFPSALRTGATGETQESQNETVQGVTAKAELKMTRDQKRSTATANH